MLTTVAGTASDALFRPVRDGNAFEETVERLLQGIRLGVVAPGDRLPSERELAAMFNVSRVTLREAIRALQHAGYVQSRRGRYGGTFVAPVLPRPRRPSARTGIAHQGSGLDDVLTLRQVLEVGAAEVAAGQARSPAVRQHLQARLGDVLAAGPEDYRRLDSRLHLAIAEATGSASLTSAVADIRMRLNELLDAIPLLERNIRHSDEQHAAIISAIVAGDPVAARESMAEHVSGTASLLRGFLV